MAVVRLAAELPANVQMGAGPAPLTCWSAKPIHIGDWGWRNLAKGRRCCLATVFGRPICTNMCRLEVNLISPFQAGEGTERPRSLWLPANQASTSDRMPGLSLRIVNRISLRSMSTLTL